MSRSEESSPRAGSWTETIHSGISWTSGAVHRAVSAVAGHHDTVADTESTTTGTTSHHSTDTMTAQEPTTGAAPRTKTSKEITTSPIPTPSASQQGAQTVLPTLTDTSVTRSGPRRDPSSSGPPTGSPDFSQAKSKDHPSWHPPPQASVSGSSITGGDASDNTNRGPQGNHQNVQGGSASDSKSQLSRTQDSGSDAGSRQDTFLPGALVSAQGSPEGESSSGQEFKRDKQDEMDSHNENTPKSQEDAEISGVGQKYIKSSGVAAKGGDFDAAKSGAGVLYTLCQS